MIADEGVRRVSTNLGKPMEMRLSRSDISRGLKRKIEGIRGVYDGCWFRQAALASILASSLDQKPWKLGCPVAGNDHEMSSSVTSLVSDKMRYRTSIIPLTVPLGPEDNLDGSLLCNHAQKSFRAEPESVSDRFVRRSG
jgi:hypothetical protein